MHTWPELLAQLKHLQTLVVKQQGGKRRELERRIAALQAQAKNISARELGATKPQKDK
jgi:hypothetical protein